MYVSLPPLATSSHKYLRTVQKPSAETQLIRPAQKGTVAGQKRANPSEDATPRNKEEQKHQATDDAAFDRFKKRFRYP